MSTEPLDREQLKKADDTAHARAQLKGRPLPPANWHACAWNAKETKLVHSYLRIRVRYGNRIKGTHASLECGNAKFGYKHILNGHQDDWSQESWYIGQNWRDLAGFSIKHILSDPDKVVSRKDKSWCWSRAIFLYKWSGAALEAGNAGPAIETVTINYEDVDVEFP
ncbi:hypothetical protein [Streptomyces halobius]|uniref:Uncharacterized protein n=1 Tax=Streptomyces halobius TaxID=2879846 RepID=A0ABY4M4L8_9ACTN|nr:hypothetical protein [Streptomyces halobius]UQA92128.1 hypothetical protein K9S39_09975 [Streptomyces halobius]